MYSMRSRVTGCNRWSSRSRSIWLLAEEYEAHVRWHSQVWQGKKEDARAYGAYVSPVRLMVIVAFELLVLGGVPRRAFLGVVGLRICHNSRGEGGKREYYYPQHSGFICYPINIAGGHGGA